MKKGFNVTPTLVVGFTAVFLIVFAFLIVYDSFLNVNNLLQKTCPVLESNMVNECENKFLISRLVTVGFIIVILVSIIFIAYTMLKGIKGVNDV